MKNIEDCGIHFEGETNGGTFEERKARMDLYSKTISTLESTFPFQIQSFHDSKEVDPLVEVSVSPEMMLIEPTKGQIFKYIPREDRVFRLKSATSTQLKLTAGNEGDETYYLCYFDNLSGGHE